jgi:hypothetical protein
MYTLQEKPDTHDSHASHTSPHTWQPFVESSTKVNGSTTPNYIPSTSAYQSIGPHPISLPLTTIEVVRENQASIDVMLHWFTGLIYPACDQYIQYLLAGANPLFLNRQGRGLQPWRCRLSTSLSPPFPTDGPLLSPKASIQFLVNTLNITSSH